MKHEELLYGIVVAIAIFYALCFVFLILVSLSLNI